MTVPGNLSVDDPSAPFTRQTMAYRSRRVLRRIREVIGDDPVYLPIVLRATPTGTVRQITDATQIVIEGYPRSGNTFAFFALKHAEALKGRDVEIASHVHTPSQVKLAVHLRYPTLLVIRTPLDAVVSLLIAAPHVRFPSAIHEWIHHHEELLPYRDDLVTGSFPEVTKDFGAVTQRVNERFATDFACFDPTPEDTEAVFAAIERNHQVLHGGTENVVPRPSELRGAEKAWLLEQLAQPRYAGMLEHARGVYDEFVPPG
jgi:hypothetical protein